MAPEQAHNSNGSLEELVNDIIKKECVLFTGSGLTQKSGGISCRVGQGAELHARHLRQSVLNNLFVFLLLGNNVIQLAQLRQA